MKIGDFFFLFLFENICYDPSSEPSRGDGSHDGSTYISVQI